MYDQFNPNFYAHLEDDSAMIQAAVDAAKESRAAVTIPRYNERTGKYIWNISRSIKLYTGSVIYLDNCHLRQADDCNTNIFRNFNNGTPKGFTRMGRQSDISIIGKGNALLDGGEHTGATEDNYKEFGLLGPQENSMLYFMNVEQVHIRNLRIVSQRYRAMSFYYSSYVHISDIDFYAPCQWQDQDGISLHTGCSHFQIKNITGVVGESVVALLNLQNYREPLMRGAQYDDSIHNIFVQNVCCAAAGAFVRTANHGGRKIYNVLIQDCMAECESDPTDKRSGPGRDNTKRPGGYSPIDDQVYCFPQEYAIAIGDYKAGIDDPDGMAKYGDTYNITIRNLTCRCYAGVYLSCSAKDVLIENVRMYGQGLTAVYFAQGPVRNVQVRDVYYSENCKAVDALDDRLLSCELGAENKDLTVLPQRQLCAVYFKDSDVENADFRNIYAGQHLTSVFGGYGKASITASGITKARQDLPTNAGVGINLTEQ